MDTKRYKEIRTRGDFFYQYFTESGGKIPEPIFNFAFTMWLNAVSGMHLSKAKKEITKFLDKKFGYTT